MIQLTSVSEPSEAPQHQQAHGFRSHGDEPAVTSHRRKLLKLNTGKVDLKEDKKKIYNLRQTENKVLVNKNSH